MLRPQPFGERLGQLAARGDLELAVGAPEVRLDRLRRDEQRLGDLTIAESLRRHRRDPPLARGERVAPPGACPARPGARGDEPLARHVLERVGAAAVGEVERLGERLAGGEPVTLGEQRCAEVGERARQLERRLRGTQHLDRLAQERDPAVAARRRCRPAASEAPSSRFAPNVRAELDGLAGELARQLGLAERERGAASRPSATARPPRATAPSGFSRSPQARQSSSAAAGVALREPQPPARVEHVRPGERGLPALLPARDLERRLGGLELAALDQAQREHGVDRRQLRLPAVADGVERALRVGDRVLEPADSVKRVRADVRERAEGEHRASLARPLDRRRSSALDRLLELARP